MRFPHTLSQDEALGRIKRLLGDVKREFSDKISDLREEWTENVGTFSFSIMGLSFSGTLTVDAHEAKLSADLPFIVRLAANKQKIESVIRERAESLLAQSV